MYEGHGDSRTKSLMFEKKITDMTDLLNKQLEIYKAEEDTLKVKFHTFSYRNALLTQVKKAYGNVLEVGENTCIIYQHFSCINPFPNNNLYTSKLNCWTLPNSRVSR